MKKMEKTCGEITTETESMQENRNIEETVEESIGENESEVSVQVTRLRKSTGMNRKEFCAYFGIPYRTVTEWERGTRKMPDYVLRLLAYRIAMETLETGKSEKENAG